MTYFFQCNGAENCKNTEVDEKYCDEEPFVCNGEEYVSTLKRNCQMCHKVIQINDNSRNKSLNQID